MEVWTCQSKQAERRQSGADSHQVGGRDVKGGGGVEERSRCRKCKETSPLFVADQWHVLLVSSCLYFLCVCVCVCVLTVR